MKPKTKLGWILIVLGAIFLICGLYLLMNLALQDGISGSMDAELPGSTSIWTRMMDYSLELLSVDWTPSRIGVFLILVGLALEAGGGYLLLSSTTRRRRK